MTWNDVIPWFLVILGADVCAEILMQFVRKWRKQHKKIPFDSCEICGKPRRLKFTTDSQKNACRTCRKLYNNALNQQMPAAEG